MKTYQDKKPNPFETSWIIYRMPSPRKLNMRRRFALTLRHIPRKTSKISLQLNK